MSLTSPFLGKGRRAPLLRNMPPHGPGFSGALHSHDPEFPNDDWNLYANLDKGMTTALNCEEPEKAVGIFKPFARRLNPEPFVESDADEELMIVAHFGDSPVHIHKLMVIGGGGEGQTGHDTHPNKLRCYVNRTDLDFSSIDEYPVSQDFDLHVNANGKPYCRIVPSLGHSNLNQVPLLYALPCSLL